MQRILDAFNYARKYASAFLAFVSIRLYGSEVSFRNVLDQRLPSTQTEIDMGSACDADTVLDLAKERHEGALNRRLVVSEKLKTLLTLGSLMLGAIGLLVPKGTALGLWSRLGLYVCALMLLNTIVLLLASLEVRAEMNVSLTQEAIAKEGKELKKEVAGDYLRCAHDADEGSDYLVEVYKAAKLFLSSSLWLAAILLTIIYSWQPKRDSVTELVAKLRGDPELVELLRGPKGEQGEPSNEEVVIQRILRDPRLRRLIVNTASDSSTEVSPMTK